MESTQLDKDIVTWVDALLKNGFIGEGTGKPKDLFEQELKNQASGIRNNPPSDITGSPSGQIPDLFSLSNKKQFGNNSVEFKFVFHLFNGYTQLNLLGVNLSINQGREMRLPCYRLELLPTSKESYHLLLYYHRKIKREMGNAIVYGPLHECRYSMMRLDKPLKEMLNGPAQIAALKEQIRMYLLPRLLNDKILNTNVSEEQWSILGVDSSKIAPFELKLKTKPARQARPKNDQGQAQGNKI